MSIKKETYQQLLYLFVGNDEMKPGMNRPFVQEGYCIATNGNYVIYIKEELLKGISFMNEGKPPNAISILPKFVSSERTFKADYLKEIINYAKNQFNKRFLVEDKKCPDCYACGYVDYIFRDYLGEVHEIESECPSCDEKGNVRMVTDLIKNESVLDNPMNILQLGDTFFDIEVFGKLLQVSDALNESEIKLTFKKSNTNAFKFKVGECIILLMPVYPNEEIKLNTLVTEIK